MRIAISTDFHIGREDEDAKGVDVRGNFLRLLSRIDLLRPDQLVLLGDFCLREPDESVYRWVREQLDRIGIPYDFISGNHDDPQLLARTFQREDLLQDGGLVYHRDWEGRPVLFLDTTPGIVSPYQLSWLADQLSSLNKDVIIFMHHPPFLARVPYMDSRYPLLNREPLEQLFFRFPHRIQVFSGHYHIEKTISCRNVDVFITPSCYFQIDQHSEDFKVDHHRIAIRILDLTREGIWQTVEYL